MIKYAIAAFAVLASPAVAVAQVDFTTLFRQGVWDVAVGSAKNGMKICVMSTSWRDGRYLGVKYIPARTENWIIHVNRDSWRIPKTVEVFIRYEFDNMGPWTFADAKSFGDNGEFLEFFVKKEATKTFASEFYAARRMIIQFPGSEPDWHVNMSGSAANLLKFVECITTLKGQSPTPRDTQPFSNPTQPFAPSTQPHQKPTQPFTPAVFQ